MRQLIALVVLLLGGGMWLPAAQEIPLLRQPDSLKFAVIGDNGTGDRPEYEVAEQMVTARATFPFEMVLMLGDNMYGRQDPQDFVDKFERPYAALLQAQIPFYATLGNHDKPSNRSYKGFNMKNERYYSFTKKNARFYVFDTNQLDAKQIAWIDEALQQPQDGWKICYFHHPLYSDAGRHGPNIDLRVVLEPMLVRYGVNVVFAGHEHVYERLKPQKGITHFIAGSSGQLRKGDLNPAPEMAAGFDQDQVFMLVEIAGDEMRFQTISRTGRVVDSGAIQRRPQT